LLYDDSQFERYFKPECIKKSLERRMSQIGWSGLKITLNVVSTKFLNNCDSSIKVLSLNESFELPDGLDCKSLDTLLIFFDLGKIMPSSISFFEKFSNLRSFRLNNATINNNIVSILSKLPSLKAIYLYKCTVI
jgi:hypothetical protein